MVIRVIRGALKAHPVLTINSAHYQFRLLSIQLIISADGVKTLEIRYLAISSSLPFANDHPWTPRRPMVQHPYTLETYG